MTAAATEKTFEMIVQAAILGQRCPTNEALPTRGKYVGHLAKAGRIVVEVFDKNFRCVTILEGQHKGKATADPPPVAKASGPYLVVDRNGVFRNGAPVDTRTSRPQPRPRETIRGF